MAKIIVIHKWFSYKQCTGPGLVAVNIDIEYQTVVVKHRSKGNIILRFGANFEC